MGNGAQALSKSEFDGEWIGSKGYTPVARNPDARIPDAGNPDAGIPYARKFSSPKLKRLMADSAGSEGIGARPRHSR